MKLPSHTKTKQPSGSRAPFYWQGQFCKWPALLSKDHDRFTDSWLSIPRVLRQQPIEGCTHDHNKVCVHVMYKSRQRSKHVRRCDDCNKSRPFKPSVEYMNINIYYIYLFIHYSKNLHFAGAWWRPGMRFWTSAKTSASRHCYHPRGVLLFFALERCASSEVTKLGWLNGEPIHKRNA